MRRIRVLVVDDSLVVRRIVSDVLGSHPGIELIGTAANGAIALQRIAKDRPDVITLDIEMPDINGLDLLTEIRASQPRLPVIMFSSLTERAAAITLEALARGATDYVPKPSGGASLEAATEYVRRELQPKVLALGARSVTRDPAGSAAPVASPRPARAMGRRAPVEIIAIGASTGGTTALATLFAQIPASVPVPIVVVLHMPPLFTKLFADRMTASCPIPFHEAVHGEPLLRAHAYLAPGGMHLMVRRTGTTISLATSQDPPENSCRPAVDVLFRSVASVYGSAALGVVLTGMGQDGLRGCEALRRGLAQVVVQDEASSVVWGMPGFVARAGLADAILPLRELPSEIMRRVERPGAAATGAVRGH